VRVASVNNAIRSCFTISLQVNEIRQNIRLASNFQ